MRHPLWILTLLVFLTACGGPRAAIVYPEGRQSKPVITESPEQNAAVILEYGFDALSARVRLLRCAERQIDLQYYIWHPDYSGRVLMHEVLAAADRGVQVRIIVDGMGAKDCLRHLRKLTVHDRIEVRVFNSLGAGLAKAGNIFRIDSLQRRMHNKLIVIDDDYALTGGRNLGDTYFWTDGDMAFLDLDILAVGPVVAEAASSFTQYWTSPRVRPLETIYSPMSERRLEQLREELTTLAAPEPIAQRLNAALSHDALQRPRKADYGPYTGAMHFFADDPEKTDPTLSDEERRSLVMAGAIDDVLAKHGVRHKQLDIANAYFIPSSKQVAHLSTFAANGARIRVLTNSLMATDVPMVHAAYAPQRRSLLDIGVELWELRAFAIKHGKHRYHDSLALHTKMILIDDDVSLIGSANLDPRSRNLNTELAVMLTNRDCTAMLRRSLDEICSPRLSFAVSADDDSPADLRWTWEDHNGQTHSATREPHRSLWRGFLQNVYHVVIPTSML